MEKAITNYLTKKVFNIKDIPKLVYWSANWKLEELIRLEFICHIRYPLGDKQYGKKI